MWAQIVSSILKGVSSIMGAGLERAQDDYTIKTLKNNAIINKAMARDAISRGQLAEGSKRKETGQRVGEARAIQGGSGVEVNTGSAAQSQADISAMGEIDALLIREGSERESLQFEQAAEQNLSQAKMIHSARKIKMHTTLMGGATNASSSWQQGQTYQNNNQGGGMGGSTYSGSSGVRVA